MALQYNYLPVVKTPIVEESAASRYDRDYLHMGKKVVPENLFEGDDRYSDEVDGDGNRIDKPYAGATAMNEDDRKKRQLDHQPDDRQARLYVNAETGVSATGKTHAVATVLWKGRTGSKPDPTLTNQAILDAYESLLEMENTNLPDQSGM